MPKKRLDRINKVSSQLLAWVALLLLGSTLSSLLCIQELADAVKLLERNR